MDRILFSSVKMDWTTPEWLLRTLNQEFTFDFDPCPYPKPAWNGLSVEWGERNFVNPPYGREQVAWVKKGVEEWRNGKLVVFLLPARTDTKIFHELILPNAEIRFLRGRLKFGNAKNSAPFPSMIVILRPKANN